MHSAQFILSLISKMPDEASLYQLARSLAL